MKIDESIKVICHVIPVGDSDIDGNVHHFATSGCWCHPFAVEPNLFAHNAVDIRERWERQGIKGMGYPWVTVLEEG